MPTTVAGLLNKSITSSRRRQGLSERLSIVALPTIAIMTREGHSAAHILFQQRRPLVDSHCVIDDDTGPFVLVALARGSYPSLVDGAMVAPPEQ
ncbi:MAG: hypothetical protein NTV86_15375 [Planctomycetota bacterium]|nr:hypothetical protein [Planctomycetota bacterium]